MKNGNGSEEWCFDIKDGGSLVICDNKNLPKAYHFDCVSTNDSFLARQRKWICSSHSCGFCQKNSKDASFLFWSEDKDDLSKCESMDGQSEGNNMQNERKRKLFRKRFVSWASVELLQFLNVIGKNTGENMTEGEVKMIINDYIEEQKLVDPIKKRTVVCDGRLELLLRRKTFNRNCIRSILEPHFAKNLVESEIVMGVIKDFMVSCNNTKTEVKDSIVASKKPKTSNKEDEHSKIERALRVHRTKFAAIIAENIKLVYLKRSLLIELFKQPETFEDKVTGCFVRVKCDDKKRNSYQLMQVTGIQKGLNGEEYDKMILLVSGMPKEVCPSMLSNDDFTEEECEEFSNQVKSGRIKRPTVVELLQKAWSLHIDITKHWIARELVLLQSRIDRARENGWREKLNEFLKMKQLLETPAEQKKLLGKFPGVIPDRI